LEPKLTATSQLHPGGGFHKFPNKSPDDLVAFTFHIVVGVCSPINKSVTNTNVVIIGQLQDSVDGLGS
jgi:hypothetical protein